MEMSMPKHVTKERPDESQPERRIVKFEFEEITRVFEFKIFAVQPDGKKGRVVGGGAFEEQDLERVAEELINLADDEALIQRLFRGIEEEEGEDG
jgi:hypothetical protein